MKFILKYLYKFYDKGTDTRSSFIHKIHEFIFSRNFLVKFFFSVNISPDIIKEGNFRNFDHKFDLTTILLKKTLNNYIKSKNKILEIGTGSFALLSIHLNKFYNINIDAVEVDKINLQNAKINIKYNRSNINIFYSDIFSNIKDSYDLIFWNLPYYLPKEKYLFPLIDRIHNFLNNDGIVLMGYNTTPLKESEILKYLNNNKQLFHYKTHEFIWNNHQVIALKKK